MTKTKKIIYGTLGALFLLNILYTVFGNQVSTMRSEVVEVKKIAEKIDGKNNEVSLTSEIAALRAEQKAMQNKIAELETAVKQLASAERSRLQAEIELLSKQVQDLNAK